MHIVQFIIELFFWNKLLEVRWVDHQELSSQIMLE